MKKNLLIITIAVVFGMISFTSSAFAAWYTVDVNKVGGTTVVMVQLTDVNGAFNKTWFKISGVKSDQILATVLTAVSLDKKLSIQLNSTASFSELTGCYLQND